MQTPGFIVDINGNGNGNGNRRKNVTLADTSNYILSGGPNREHFCYKWLQAFGYKWSPARTSLE